MTTIDIYELTPTTAAPVAVIVRHTGWHLFGQVNTIALPLVAGHVVEFQGGPRWCQAAAEGAAFQISAALLARGILHTHAVVFQDGVWFVQFSPLEVM